MTEDRRKQWMAVFEWCKRHKGTPEIDSLWIMLNELLQQEQDPEFQSLMQDIDRAFSEKLKPPLES